MRIIVDRIYVSAHKYYFLIKRNSKMKSSKNIDFLCTEPIFCFKT